MKNLAARRVIIRLSSISLALVFLFSIASPAYTVAPVPGEDPWVEEEAAAEKHTSGGGKVGYQIRQIGEPMLHDGHLGFDKKTGESLDDPTIHVPEILSPQDQVENQQYYQQKLQGVDPTRVTFRSGYSIHPEAGIAANVLKQLGAGTGSIPDENYYIIQFSYPFPTQARRNLEEVGVKFYDYVDVAGLYASVPPQAEGLLQSLLVEGLIRYVGTIPPQAKLAPELAERSLAPETDQDVIVLTFGQLTQDQMNELESLMVVERQSDGPMHIIEGRATDSAIQALTKLRYIRWVESQPVNTLGNLEGGMGIGADVVRGKGFDGDGVNVMVVDTGIARSGSTYHPDLLSGRIVDQYDYQNSDIDAADDNSHGTHVAGSIGGRYNSSDLNSEESWQGVAPGVDYYIYKLCCGPGQFSSTWFQQALQRGTSSGRTTHVSSNSWGGGNGVYNTASEIADRAVRGEYNSTPINMVIISHNQNLLTTAPGTGKNVITVGSVKDGNYPNTPFTSCSAVDDYDWPPGERVCYSNYGPLDIDGDSNTRVKPDVMAPGAMIYSTTPWYMAGVDYYGFKDGTSMAAPHVSGAIAQILDAYSTSNPWLFNWPETIKAMLLATTVDVGGNTDLYGRGLVDPYHSIYYQPGINSMRFWGDTLNSSGDTKDFTFSVPTGYEEVRLVLTWPDPAGSTEVSNDLDILWVKDGGGTMRGLSRSSDDTVEYVSIPTGYNPGTWTVRVEAFSLSSSQTFGLAAHPIIEGSNLNITASAPSTVDPVDYFYFHQYISNNGYTAGGSYARLYVPNGFTVQGVRIYTDDSYSHYYDDSEIYHVSGSNYWRAAVGETIAQYPRHVRWYIRADPGISDGVYTFSNNVYWREGGVLQASGGANTYINVGGGLYLPLILKN
ncbi:MAG: S8 family serine peptidase [Anaerolineales bacterium]